MTNPTLELILEDDTFGELSAEVADQVEDAVVDVTGGPVTAFPEDKPVVNVTQGKGYEEISDAVDNANKDDTIVVEDGTYHGSVEINDEGLTLEAADGDDPTINANGDNNAISVSVVNPEDSDAGVTISGFEFAGFSERAIVAGYEGANADAPSDVPVHIRGNHVPSNGNDPRGAFTVGADGSSISGNVVTGGDLDDPAWQGFGIAVDGAKNVSITGNKVIGESDNVGIGITSFFGDVETIDIKDNHVEGDGAIQISEQDYQISAQTINISDNSLHSSDWFVNTDDLLSKADLEDVQDANDFDPDDTKVTDDGKIVVDS